MILKSTASKFLLKRNDNRKGTNWKNRQSANIFKCITNPKILSYDPCPKILSFFLDWHGSMVCLTWKINIFQGFRRQPVCGGAAAHGVTPILHVDEVGGDDDERDGNGGVVKVQARPNVGTRLRT